MRKTGSAPLEEARTLQREAETEANRFNLKCMTVLSGLAVISLLLHFFGLFNVARVIMLPSMVVAALFFLFPTLLRFLLRKKKDLLRDPRFKIIIIACSYLGIAFICVTLAFHAIVLMPVPPLMAAQYRMDRRVFRWALALTVILVPIGVYGSFFFGITDRNLLKGIADSSAVSMADRLALATPKRMWELSYHYVLPRLLGVVAIVFLVYGITARYSRFMDRQAELARQVRQEMERLNAVQSKVIDSLATLIENRDEDTGEHVFRTKLYVRLIGLELRKDERFRDRLTEEELDGFVRAAPLHDVGKIAVPDSILMKPGRLTPEEFEEMKTHTTRGGGMVKSILSGVNEESFLRTAEDIVLYHHERWDGSGYPEGLKGEDIPLSARIMAVADVYDALVSPRVYKEPVPPEEALDTMLAESGSHFDPEIMDIVRSMRDTLITAARTPISQ